MRALRHADIAFYHDMLTLKRDVQVLQVERPRGDRRAANGEPTPMPGRSREEPACVVEQYETPPALEVEGLQARNRVCWISHINAVRNSIAGPAQEDPDGVDAALVTLIQLEEAPYAQLRTTALSPGEAFYAAKWSYLHQNALADSSVLEVDNDNAFCQRWPKASSFISKDPILQGGGSGRPSWVGDTLVGLVHGEK